LCDPPDPCSLHPRRKKAGRLVTERRANRRPAAAKTMEKKLQASTTRRLGQSRSLINSLSRANELGKNKTTKQERKKTVAPPEIKNPQKMPSASMPPGRKAWGQSGRDLSRTHHSERKDDEETGRAAAAGKAGLQHRHRLQSLTALSSITNPPQELSGANEHGEWSGGERGA